MTMKAKEAHWYGEVVSFVSPDGKAPAKRNMVLFGYPKTDDYLTVWEAVNEYTSNLPIEGYVEKVLVRFWVEHW